MFDFPKVEGSFMPKVEISEENGLVKISSDLPGLTKDDIKVVVSKDNVLSISGERKAEESKEEEKDGRKIHRTEKHYGRFVRRFELPPGTDASKIDVKFQNGVLDIVIPKSEEKLDDHVLHIKD